MFFCRPQDTSLDSSFEADPCHTCRQPAFTLQGCNFSGQEGLQSGLQYGGQYLSEICTLEINQRQYNFMDIKEIFTVVILSNIRSKY